MERIREIFYKGLKQPEESIIKQIEINWPQHAAGVVNIAKSIQPNFEITEENQFVLKELLLYFSGNKNFNGSLNKGLFLVGPVGTGKSLFMNVFKKYTSEILKANSFRVYQTSNIIDSVNISGAEYLELFNDNYNNPITCYIDDISSQNEEVKHFGTSYNVIEQLLSIRYYVYSRYKKLTHISTNKYPKEMVKIYDKRIVDRMREMFNIIELKGKSFRK